MPAIKIRVPRTDLEAYAGETLSVAVKARLAEALANLAQAPAPEPLAHSTPSDSVTLWISEAQEKQITGLMVTHRIDGAGPAASGLLHALARAALPAEDPAPAVPAGAETTLDAINRALGDSARLDQSRFFVDLRAEVLGERPPHTVVFAEASTGTGKTRAFLAVALDWLAAHPGEHVVVASPSYSVLLQTLGQWHRIEASGAMPSMAVVVGMQEFVSRAALERLLQDSPEAEWAEAVQRWVAGGGKPAEDDAFGHAWMARSLIATAGGQWTLTDEVRVDGDTAEDDPGVVAYHQQFKDGKASDVVFCTHAMLAADVRLCTSQAGKAFSAEMGKGADKVAWEAWHALSEKEGKVSKAWELRNDMLRDVLKGDAGRLPSIGLLIVDEAHLLEQSFASVFANAISISRLMTDLRRLHETWPRAVQTGDLGEVIEAWNSLREYGRTHGGERETVADRGALHTAVNRVSKAITGIVGRLPRTALARREARKLRSVKTSLDIAARGADERFGMRVQVSWSPTYKWPGLNVGRYDVSRELDFLWSVLVRDRSVLVSATLFEDVSLLGLEGMRRTLSVRQKSVRPLSPVRPAWLYEPVTLYEAGASVHADGLPRFRRPVHRDKLDAIDHAERLERWRSDVAGYVAGAYASAAGGVLVLLTSHEERAELVGRIEKAIPPACLLSQGDGRSLESLRSAFLALAARGERPCLVAVGAAWTGLDLSPEGVAPGDDNVLTDLIIPVAPLGTNRTLTHEWRRERTGVVAEIGATSIMFRQGIGRLVRRDGLQANRRLHFLDARIHDSQWRGVLQPIIRALGRYAKKRVV